MRTMLLSIKPSVYEKIKDGHKIFEHRRSFPNEPIKAYMYVSSPVCAITGILYLGKRHQLSDWRNEYRYDPDAIERIVEYEKHYRYAMEIKEFQETNRIPLQELRNKLQKFVVPQMYYYLDGTELLDFLEENITYGETKIVHDFSNIKATQLCQN